MLCLAACASAVLPEPTVRFDRAEPNASTENRMQEGLEGQLLETLASIRARAVSNYKYLPFENAMAAEDSMVRDLRAGYLSGRAGAPMDNRYSYEVLEAVFLGVAARFEKEVPTAGYRTCPFTGWTRNVHTAQYPYNNPYVSACARWAAVGFGTLAVVIAIVCGTAVWLNPPTSDRCPKDADLEPCDRHHEFRMEATEMRYFIETERTGELLLHNRLLDHLAGIESVYAEAYRPVHDL